MNEYLSTLTPWQVLAFMLFKTLVIYGLLCFIFSPITSRLDRIEKAIKELGRGRYHEH